MDDPLGPEPRERLVTDIAAEIKDILVFHLGAEEGLLTDDARLVDDLGADRLDLVEIAMSCEERFDVDIPNHVAIGLATVGDAVRFVQAQVAATTGRGPGPSSCSPAARTLVRRGVARLRPTGPAAQRRPRRPRNDIVIRARRDACWRQGDGDACHPDAGRRRPGRLRPAAGRRGRRRRDVTSDNAKSNFP